MNRIMKVLVGLFIILPFTNLKAQTVNYYGEIDGLVVYEKINQNGNLMETGHYYNKKQDGTWISYHPNGKVYTKALYSNGKKVGTWKIYDETGLLLAEVKYENNKKSHAKIIKHYIVSN